MAIEWRFYERCWQIFMDDDLWRTVDAKIFGKKPSEHFTSELLFEEEFFEVEYRLGYRFIVLKLARQGLSAFQVQALLKKHLLSDLNSEKILAELKRLGFIDDQLLADSLVRREKRLLKSKQAIVQKLKAKKLPLQFVIDEKEEIRELIKKRYPKLNLESPEEKQKLIRRLMMRGFSFDAIRSALSD
ncbi:MAG: recX [Chlamydiales bacterium]|jgi:SOS response regulatory protein OraA/RecX|nr:recX [Chlamydiales bacterium]